MTKALSLALQALQRLTDDEQRVLDNWFSASSRNSLRIAGISDAEIGPLRKGVDYWPDGYVEEIAPLGGPARPERVSAVQCLRVLDDNEFEAIGEWFRFETRKPLRALGATDAEIGPERVVPDQIPE